MLGSRAKHKNLEVVLQHASAFDAMGLDLVIVGVSAPAFAKMAGPGGAQNIRSLGFVDDNCLAALFAQAACFAFPSCTEGFGTPVLRSHDARVSRSFVQRRPAF